MKKNGTTSKGTTRWRCKNPTCGASLTQPRPNTQARQRFEIFSTWAASTSSLSTIARHHHVTRRTLTRWFHPFWTIQIPTNTDPHRIHDQVFIDGTYFNNKCLLVAATDTYVLAWRWCATEDSFNYTALLNQLSPPLVVTTDGQRGALKAITATWPDTAIQRCLVHVKRNIQTYVTLHPVTPAGKALRRLSLDLLKVTTPDEAAEWIAHLNNVHTSFHSWLNARTYREDVDEQAVPAFARNNKKWWYTHYRHRSAYRLLERLYKAGHLFTFLTPPDECDRLKSTTNSLEGGINAQLKHLARAHRGTPNEHQRALIDWWLYLHTEHHDDPHTIAARQDYGAHGKDIAQQLLKQELRSLSSDAAISAGSGSAT